MNSPAVAVAAFQPHVEDNPLEDQKVVLLAPVEDLPEVLDLRGVQDLLLGDMVLLGRVLSLAHNAAGSLVVAEDSL